MLSRLIMASYKVLLEVSMWLILVASFIGGWAARGLLGAIFSLFGAFIFCVVVFGAFLMLADIHSSIKVIEDRKG